MSISVSEIYELLQKSSQSRKASVLEDIPKMLGDNPDFLSESFCYQMTRLFLETPYHTDARNYKNAILEILTTDNFAGVSRAICTTIDEQENPRSLKKHLEAVYMADGFSISGENLQSPQQKTTSRMASLLSHSMEKFGISKNNDPSVKYNSKRLDGYNAAINASIKILNQHMNRIDKVHSPFIFMNCFNAITFAATYKSDNLIHAWKCIQNAHSNVIKNKDVIDDPVAVFRISRKALHAGQEIYISLRKIEKRTRISGQASLRQAQYDIFDFTKNFVSFMAEKEAPLTSNDYAAQETALKSLRVFYHYDHPLDGNAERVVDHTRSELFLSPDYPLQQVTHTIRLLGVLANQMEDKKALNEPNIFKERLLELSNYAGRSLIQKVAHDELNPDVTRSKNFQTHTMRTPAFN